MNGRNIFVLLALSLSSSLAAACGGDEPAQERSSTLHLRGTYRPTQAGAISSITFSNDKDYLLVPAGCTGGACFDIGTYRFDAQASTVILRSSATARERTITLEQVKTSEAAAVLVKSFARTTDFSEPEALVKRGQQTTNNGQQTTDGQGQVSGDQSQLNNGQSQLAQQIGELVKTIIEAIMNGQQMKQDEQDKDEDEKDEDEKEPEPQDCKQGVPTENSTQAERDLYAARCPNGP